MFCQTAIQLKLTYRLYNYVPERKYTIIVKLFPDKIPQSSSYIVTDFCRLTDYFENLTLSLDHEIYMTC